MSMDTVSIDAIFLKHFVVAHGNGEIKEDDWGLFSSFLPNEGNHLLKVKFLKERGNEFFKQNQFESAGGCYDMACRLLCLVLESEEDYQGEPILQLAISLNLNLAACANKLHEYGAAINFSSLVLLSFPKNAKALFRRAIACMKMNMLLEAQTDLETASMLEPKNKDILRELIVVKNLRAINHNGKRNLDEQLLGEVDKESKRHIPISDFDNSRDKLVDDNGGSSSGSCVSPCDSIVIDTTCSSESGLPENFENNSSLTFDLEQNHKDTHMGDNGYTPNNSFFEFSRKGGGNSRLRISGQDYQKILQGAKVIYYHKRDLSTMTIRALSIEVTKDRDITRPLYKRKKRRRRSKKRKSMRVVNDDTTTSPSGAINGIDGFSSRESSVGGVSLGSSSICDNLSTPLDITSPQGKSTVVASSSCLLDTSNSIFCFQAHKDPIENRSFLSSSYYPKKCRFPSFGKLSRAWTTRRCRRFPSNCQVSEKEVITESKKNYSQGDESPRRNVSACFSSRSFSRKFLRPRGVSVSCCRYSPEAQLMRKRKEVLARLASSDRPQKKPFLFVNPNLSLMSLSNYVIINPDSESRVRSL